MYRRESARLPTMTGSSGSVILGILLVLAVCILPVQALDNPVPVITKISLTYSDAGISSVTITVTGSSFLSGSVVQWDGVAKPTTYVSATKLTVKIPGDDLKYPKTAKIRVYNPPATGGGGGGYSKELSFTVKAAFWIKSIWPAVVELDPVTLKIKGPTSYWEVNKANADPLADYIFGLGVTGTAANPQVYFLDAQTKFPSSTTKNSIWQLDMATGRSTKVQALPKFAHGLGTPSPTRANLFYYAEGKNLHIIENGAVVQSLALPVNIGGIDVVTEDGDTPFILAVSRDPGHQKIYRVNLDGNGRFVPPFTQPLTIKATPDSLLYPYMYTGVAFARFTLGDGERKVLYVVKDDGSIEPWDRIGIVDFMTGDILAEANTDDLGIEVDSSTTWQSGTSGYLSYANPSGIDFVDGRLFVSSLHYWNKGDKWLPIPEGKCISGMKWDDTDGDGIKDANEHPIGGWTIYLYKQNAQNQWVYQAETTTGPDGTYKFCNLAPCNWYKVAEETDGYVQTYPKGKVVSEHHPKLDDDFYTIYLKVCTNVYNKNFGNKKVDTGKIIIIKDGQGCLVPPADMMGWWTGDGTANDRFDGNHGTLLNGATFAGGKVGQAFLLDGVDDTVQVSETMGGASLDGYGQLTLDAWVKPNTLTPAYQTIVSKYDGSQDDGVSYWLGLRPDGKVQFSVYSKYTATPFTSTGWTAETVGPWVPMDTFTHVAGVWKGGADLKIYINGYELTPAESPVVPNANGPGGLTIAANTAPVTIGSVWREGPGSTGPGLFYKGLIDEVEIFDRALSANEVKSISDAGSSGKCKVVFTYTAGPAPLGPFGLTLGGQKVFDPVPAGIYTVQETPVPPKWKLTGLVCADPNGNTIVDPATGTATIHLDGGETVTCTYTNEKENKGKIVIEKIGTSESCEAAPAGMAGWWPGDDSPEDRVNGNDGTLIGDATYAAGKVGNAFSLDGAGDAVQIPEAGAPLDGVEKLTLDAWVKPDTVDSGNPYGLQTIVAKYDYTQDNGYSYWLGLMKGGSVRFAVYTGNVGTNWHGYYADTATGAVAEDVFSHVAGVWNGGTDLKIYVNGVLVPAPVITQGSPGTSVTANAIPVSIGRVEKDPFTGQPGLYFKGLIDEVEIFGRALTQAEIQAIVAAGSDGKCKTLFPYTASPSPLGAFSLPLGGQMVFDQVLEGTYTVTETPIPDDWDLTNLDCTDPDLGTTFDTFTGIATIDLDAGETVTCTYTNEEEACAGKICGYKYHDLNGNGQMDTGDTPVAGVKIRLYPGTVTSVDSLDIGLVSSEAGHNLAGWGLVEPTNSGGNYGGITDTRVTWTPDTPGDDRPASFTLAVTDTSMDHFLLMKVLDGVADDSFIVLVNGQPVYSFTGKNNPVSGGQNYFGDPASTNVADEKWKTHGIFLAKEILSTGDNTVTVIATGPQWSSFDPYGQLAVDTVELLKLGAPIAEATTDSTGHYCFEDLDKGDYYVGEAVIPSGNVPSTHSILAKITLACNLVVEPLNFYNTGFLRICGEKYRDTNGNGLPDDGETGLGGVGMTLFTRSANPVDGVDIGDTGSEAGHSLNGWGPVEPTTSGGTWGGIDDARATWVKGDGRGASFTMNAGTSSQNELVLRMLDGQADDSFMVFVNGNPVYQYTGKNSPHPGDGNYFGDPSGSDELWHDHRIYVAGSGTLTISVAAMGAAWSGFDTYGQLGVDQADLYTLTPVAGANPVTTASDGKFCFLLTGVDLSQLPVYYIGETALPAGSIPTTGSVNDPASQPYIFRNTEMGDVSKLFDLLIVEFCPPGGFEPGDYTTYTQGGWGGPGAPGQLLANNFATVYPSGVVIGRSPDFKLTFTSSNAVKDFLPQGGTPDVLTTSATDPTTSDAGVFAGQVLALQLSVDFSDAGKTDAGLGDLVYVNPGDSLDGKTVREILAIANDVLGGGTLPAGYTVPILNDLIDHLNKAFDDGDTVTGWAEQHLKEENGSCISPLPPGAVLKVDLTWNSQTGTQTMVQGLGGHWTTEFTGLEPGCYDYRIYYQVDAQPPVTLFQGTECIPISITNTFTWEGCHAQIGIEKSGPGMGRPGDMITYTYDVTNHAEEPLANVGISDDLAINERPVTSGGFNVGDTNTDNLLDPGEVWKFEADYTLPADDPDRTLTNVVTASGDACGKTVTAWDDYTLVLFTLRKDVLLYWNGNLWPYDDPNTEFKVRVLDEAGNPLTGDLTLTEPSALYFWLRPGIYEFDETFLPPGYEEAYDSLRKMLPEDGLDWGLLNVIRYDLALTKSGPSCAAPGDQVTFTYTVTNAGPASVAPVLTDDTGTPTLTGGDTHNPGFIDPDESWTYSLVVTMPANALTNTATVVEPNEPTGWHKGGDLNKGDNTATWTVQVCFPGKVCGTKYADTDGNGLEETPEDSGQAGVGITLFPAPATLVDSIDIGAADEGSHNLQDWSLPIVPGYDGSANCRVAWIGGNAPWASFTLHNAVPGKGHLLTIEALDGIGDDSFTVKAGGRLLYAYTAKNSPLPGDGNYFGDAPSSTGIWHTHGIYVPPDVLSGTDLTVTITATGSPWSGMEQWGQLGVDHVNFYALDAVTLNGNPATTDGDGRYCFEGIDVRGSPQFYVGETVLPAGRVPTRHSLTGPVTLDDTHRVSDGNLFRNTEMYEKTFVLTLTNPQYAPAGTTYWASLTPPGPQTPITIQLTGSGTTYSGVISHLAPGTYQYRFYAVKPTVQVTIKEGSESFPPCHENTATFEWRCPPGSISGTKYLDANNDGDRDDGEGPGAGFTMRLTRLCTDPQDPWCTPVSPSLTTVTDDQGNFAFTGLAAGSYRLSEDSRGPDWVLTQPISGFYDIPLSCGESDDEYVFGNYQRAHLKLVKDVGNDGGGKALPTAWTLSAAGPTPISGPGVAEGDVLPGTYTLSESSVPGYQPGSWSCVGVIPDVNQITLGLGQSAVCTIHNEDVNLIQTGDIDKTAFVDTQTTHTWDIHKEGDETALTLLPGETATVDYEVTASETPTVTLTVRGEVTVHNPWMDPLVVKSVADAVQPGPVPASLTCTIGGTPRTFPVTLAYNEVLVCSYSAVMPSGTTPTGNTATVIVEDPDGDIVYVKEKSILPGTATEVDECIALDDDKYVPSLGTICADDAVKTKSYTLTIGPYDTCGEPTFVNTASSVTNDNNIPDSDSWPVTVTVECAQGCTYTQGYWKTHTIYDNKPHKVKRDDTWDSVLPSAEDSPFFNSGKTWYVVFTEPVEGRAYYNLAHQYMAAKLNIYNGASSTTLVNTAIAWAEAKFAAAPSDALAPADETQALAYASDLDDYNNGRIGPGHCGDEPALGSLQVTSTPAVAAISLDGDGTGEVTPHTFTDVEAGDHNIGVTKADYEPQTRVVTVPADGSVTAHFDLVQMTGSLSVTSDPAGASITLDDNPTGHVTPYTFTGLTPGSHTVSAGASYQPPSQTVVVPAGGTVNAHFTLVVTNTMVTACVVASDGTTPLPGAVIKYGSGSCPSIFGTTGEDGCVSKEFDETVTDLQVLAEYALSTSAPITQDITDDPTFEFQTDAITFRLETCDHTGLAGGKVRYGKGSAYTTRWVTGSTDSNGNLHAELFPGEFSFEMQYKATAEQKMNQVLPGASPLVWTTTAVTLVNSGGGAISYGGTGGDNTYFVPPTMELLAVTNLNVHFRDPGGGVVQLTWGPCVTCPCTFSYSWVP